jgi:hypothetical protein
LLCGLGSDQRICPTLSGEPPLNSFTDSFSGGSSGTAGSARSDSDGHPYRSLRGPGHFHHSDRRRGGAGLAGSAAADLRKTHSGGLLSRPGRFFLCGWCRIRLTLDTSRAAGQRAGHLRVGQHGSVGCRVSWTGHRSTSGDGDGLQRRGDSASHLGCSVLFNGAGRSGARHRSARLHAPDPVARETRLAAGRFLLSHLRRLCSFLHLFADVAARRFPVGPDGCWLTDGRIRGAGDPVTAGGRDPIRPDRWLARVVGGTGRHRAFCPAFRLALDDSLYGGGSRLRGAARAGQRCGIQTRAAILPRPDRYGDRFGRSNGWFGRLFPASAPSLFPGKPRSDLAGLCPAGGYRTGALVGQPTRIRGAAPGGRTATPGGGPPQGGCEPGSGQHSSQPFWLQRSWSARAICKTSMQPWSCIRSR